MSLITSISIIILTFFFMEFTAWFVHKYIMHGFLWNLHKDHHVVDNTKFFQKNDYFFLIFAIPSILLIFLGYEKLSPGFYIGVGIALYGFAYFIIHEIIIHRRFPPPEITKNKYIKLLEKLIKFITKIEENIMA